MIRISSKREEVLEGIRLGHADTDSLREYIGITKPSLVSRMKYLEEVGLVEVTRYGNKVNTFKVMDVRYKVSDDRTHKKKGSPWPQKQYPSLDFALRVMRVPA